MSSAQDYVDCPRCGKKGAYVFDCCSREEWFLCFFCGYHFETKRTIDQEKSSEEDPHFIWHEHEIKGSGSYGIKFKNRVIQLGSTKPEDTIRFMEILKNPDVDPDGSYLTRYEEESKKIEYLIGSPEKCLGLDEILASSSMAAEDDLEKELQVDEVW